MSIQSFEVTEHMVSTSSGWEEGVGQEKKDANEKARKRSWETFKEVTERDMVFLLHGFHGLPLPSSSVARQASLCDDDDKRWRDHDEGSYIEV